MVRIAMRASIQLALPPVSRELIHGGLNGARRSASSPTALEQDPATPPSASDGESESASSFRSILRDSSHSREETNQESRSSRQKSAVSGHPSQGSRQILPQAAANPLSGQSHSKTSAPRQYGGAQSDKSNNSQENGKQQDDSKEQTGAAPGAATDPPSQTSQVLPLRTKIVTPQDGTESTKDSGGSQGGSDQPDDSKKQSGVNSTAAMGYVPSREMLRMMAGLPAMPSGNVSAQGTTSESSTSAQLQVTLPTPGAAANAEYDSASPGELAHVERAAPPPMLDVANTVQAASSGPIAVAAKLTPVEADPPVAETSDTRTRGQIPFQKQAFGSASFQDDVSARLGAEPVPEHFAKAETGFAPVAPGAASSAEAPKNTSTVTLSTSTQAASQMEPLIETSAPAATAGSGHDITIKVPDSTERGMDVRFVERGGEVHVAIRTSDGEMAQTLRNGMNDFVGRMEHAGIRAEVWRPGADASPSQNQQDDSRQQPQDQRGSRNQPGMQDREDDSRNSKKPRWVEAMEDSIGSQSSQTA